MSFLARRSTSSNGIVASIARRACITASAASASTSTSARRTFTRSSITASAASSSPHVWRVDNPYSGEIAAEIPLLNEASANERIESANRAFNEWRQTSLDHRIAMVEKWCRAFEADKETIARAITQQMGKPIGQARGEVDTTIKRARALIALAPEALAEEVITHDPNPALLRKITKEPIGAVLALCPWNYPLLCAVNTVVTAVLTGNTVLLKHSDRTPLVADLFESTFKKAGFPANVVSAFHVDHALTARILSHPKIAYVQFTGSVSGGRAVYSQVAKSRFIDVGLELGGKDPAYVAADADLQYAIENVVDGGLYNAGQSCCAVERVYVHEKVYDSFVNGAKKLFDSYVLGDPLDAKTSLGPIAQPHHVAFLANHVADARAKGARVLTGGSGVKDAAGKGRFFAPTLIVDTNHTMKVVSEESFGPLLAVQKVKNDDEAVRLMNDSDYGLTASVWTSDIDRATSIGKQLNTGTVFMNRCDFLDPYLAWSGRKDSGKGIGLSSHGFAPFYRTKSWNFRPNTK